MKDPEIRLLFVCLGNICRSPTAEAVMRHLVKQQGLEQAIFIDSAGTGDWHVGKSPDARSAAVGARRGIPLGGCARQVTVADFDDFDVLLAMDKSNAQNLLALAPDAAARTKVRLLRDFDPSGPPGQDVPDPYFGGPEGFDEVFDICHAACEALLSQLWAKRPKPGSRD